MPNEVIHAGDQAVPRHIAIVMDGNGRWAQKRGLPRTAGHKVGCEVLRTLIKYCKKIGVEYVTVYAFSTENWKRSADEVSTIMGLLKRYFKEAIDSLEDEGIRLRVLGDLRRLSPELQALAHKTDEISDHIRGTQVNICVNYGGRDEIVHAASAFAAKCAAGEAKPEDLTEQLFHSYLYSAGIPDPDLVIRPSGEQRISNFLLWQSAYAEYYFTDTLWPDFTPAVLDEAIAAYHGRNRRFGGV